MKEIDVQNMSNGEKLKAMESLWGSLLGEEHEPESPNWHGEILSQRKKAIDDGKASFISVEKLREYYKS